MYKNLKDENVIVELENLVKNCNIEEDLNTTYAIFMKERILAVSGLNQLDLCFSIAFVKKSVICVFSE